MTITMLRKSERCSPIPTYKIPLDNSREEMDCVLDSMAESRPRRQPGIPIIGLLFLAVAFNMIRRDDVLLWLQRHSLMIAVVTAVPFAIIAIVYSSGGKFLGQTTPWEPVKISFLLGYAGILADQYRNLSQTRWGVPPSALPHTLFLLSSRFCHWSRFSHLRILVRCWSSLALFLTLYLVAVKRLAQVAIAAVATILLLGAAGF